ncbi:MAG: hypothetical protein ABFS41_07345 [Myxococcota bacterium]
MSDRPREWTTWILLLLGAGSIANGGFMLLAPAPWFETIAAYTGPYNVHLVQDVGAAYVTAGAAAIWAGRRPAWRTPLATSAALFIGIHGAIHVVEVLRGLHPASHLVEDFPGVYLPALLLGWIAFRSRPTHAPKE